MVKRAERVCTGDDFAQVRATGRAHHSATMTLSWTPNTLNRPRFGFIVSKRVGNAVTRNLVKRRLRAIIDARRQEIASGFDIVITARPNAAQAAFNDLAQEVDRLLRRAKLWHPRDGADSAPRTRPVEGDI